MTVRPMHLKFVEPTGLTGARIRPDAPTLPNLHVLGAAGVDSDGVVDSQFAFIHGACRDPPQAPSVYRDVTRGR